MDFGSTGGKEECGRVKGSRADLALGPSYVARQKKRFKSRPRAVSNVIPQVRDQRGPGIGEGFGPQKVFEPSR